MSVNRRDFLRILGASGAGLAFSGLARHLEAQARSYRALVCLFFFGGLDNHDTVIPYDDSAYDRWATIRRSMLAANPGYRDRGVLLPLDTSGFEGRRFALAPELAGLHDLYGRGRAAIVGNVGPLVEPVTRRTFEGNTARLPARLFSHNDQQATWLSGEPEGRAQFGWGGLMADAAVDGNAGRQFTAVSTGGSGLFLTGRVATPYQISATGAARLNVLGREEVGLLPSGVRERIARRFRPVGGRDNLIESDMADAMRNASDSNDAYNRAAASALPLTTEFGEGGVAANLRAVARAIALRESLGVDRQLFLVGMGGFDTHSNQAEALPIWQRQLDGAIASFQRAMDELGVSDQVTLFTASEFGRTLVVNGDGTDHGWGGHSFVVGGAVRGGTVYGQLPVSDLGHEHDAGNGRLIPTTATETLAASLGRWLGLDDDALRSALPRWDGRTLGVMGS